MSCVMVSISFSRATSRFSVFQQRMLKTFVKSHGFFPGNLFCCTAGKVGTVNNQTIKISKTVFLQSFFPSQFDQMPNLFLHIFSIISEPIFSFTLVFDKWFSCLRMAVKKTELQHQICFHAGCGKNQMSVTLHSMSPAYGTNRSLFWKQRHLR